MKIERFIGKSVNGYLNFDIHFFDHLTFVTGINGSGKTSILNSIAALLLPRLDYLAGEYFDEITIKIAHNNQSVGLSAKKTESVTELTCTLFPELKFQVMGFDDPDSIPPHRIQDHEEEHYRELLARNAENPILSYIDSLPTPMYLGLDRRSLTLDRDRRPYGGRFVGQTRKGRNIFGRSLEVGLREAMHFARERIQVDRRRELLLDAQFRETLVLTLIDFPPISFSGEFEQPSKDELKKFEETKSNLRRLPDLLNVDSQIISSKIDPVLSFLDQTLKKIRKKKKSTDEGQFALFEWTFNKTNMDKLNAISGIIANYNSNVSRIRKHTDDYLKTINRFMQDGRKKIVFNSSGNLRFVLEEEQDEERHINTLSSGEIQLVVILTHLYFNPEVEQANVFIIDEPELSLHVQWQEKFVDGIMDASKETQFILATHSPTVILDKIINCIEITQK